MSSDEYLRRTVLSAVTLRAEAVGAGWQEAERHAAAIYNRITEMFPSIDISGAAADRDAALAVMRHWVDWYISGPAWMDPEPRQAWLHLIAMDADWLLYWIAVGEETPCE